MRRLLLAAVLLTAAPALAQEPAGCDKFKWPLDRERALLAAPVPAPLAGTNAKPLGSAFTLSLSPYQPGPITPSRPPKPGSNAGMIAMAAPPAAGMYRVTLSAGAWIDVFQNGHEVPSTAFSGATGCEGVRKSVKFKLDAEPFTVAISGSPASSIVLVVTPD